MNEIIDNIKKVGTTNIALIIIALFLRIASIKGTGFSTIGIVKIIDALVSIVALLSGLIYAMKGYGKISHKYYKTFMLFVMLGAIVSIIIPLAKCITNNSFTITYILIIIAYIVIFGCYCVLTYKKDLGLQKSSYMCYITLALNLLLFINAIAGGYRINYVYTSIGNLLLSYITCIFVTAKYDDKQNRRRN